MAKLPRTTQKIFGKNAPENQITTFGSIKAGTPVYTQSASQIMNSAFEGGWSEAVEDDYAPYRQDRNAVDTAITQQLAYLFQDGIPEWDAGTTYYKGSVVKVVNGNALTFYKSIADNNTASVNTIASWHKMLDINASNQIVSPSINTPTISGGSMSNGTFSDPTFSGTVNVPLASQSSSTDSTIAASIGWVNNPNLSSNIVHKTGNETIGGEKTLTDNVIISKEAPILYDRNTRITRNTAPTSNQNLVTIIGQDSVGQSTWGIYHRYYTTKENRVDLICYKGTTTDNTWTGIGVGYDSSGNPYTYAPTPATSDNSTKIATTAYVKAQGYSTTDTKNTAGSTDTSSKIFLVGATSQAANPQTYSHDTVFVNTSGQLVSSTPTSSTNSTVVATTAFVKSVLSSSGNGLATYSKSAGYYKFTNGLIIQWGFADSWSGYKTITLPTPFDSTKYRVSVLNSGPTGSVYPNYKVHTKTTTDMELAASTSGAAEWIAVGY